MAQQANANGERNLSISKGTLFLSPPRYQSSYKKLKLLKVQV